MARAQLHSGFLRSAERHPDRPALEVSGETLTYAQLLDRTRSLASTVIRRLPDADPPLTAVCASRSPTAYAGLLAALLRGHGYVPLNPRFPADRTRVMLERSGAQAVITDSESLPYLETVLEGSEAPITVVLDGADLETGGTEDRAGEGGAIAYLLFTSGSTGIPKGVMVSHENACAFVEAVAERYAITEHDRFSQTFDLTFDLSVFDMFVAWERGACVCCPDAAELLKPGPWIRAARLSVWFSVPSLGLFMRRLGMLAPGAYPELRWSLFCGEPLPVSLAQEWALAAPKSIVENLYGPTELTIACMAHRVDPERPGDGAVHDLVPIGRPLPGMRAIVAGADGAALPAGSDGELLMTGPQLTLGYWRDPERTRASFVHRDDDGGAVYYRTGDVVRQSAQDSTFVFLGRVDSQVKISGFRVEMAEVERALRQAAGTDEAVAVPWPVTESSATGIVAFVQAAEVDAAAIRRAMARTLPTYMVPRTVLAVAALPLNVNGKFDRNALVERLRAGG